MSKTSAITLSWKNLNATIGEKTLINNCSGYCKPGQMLAIMGASGAGKTTLLSILSKKADPKLHLEGEVLANNTPFSSSSFYNFGVYVYQNDILHASLTVRETLKFTAVLKYNNPVEAQSRVDELIKVFQLQKCEQAYVGDQNKRGISGGEKKRVCIAVEMISRPSVLVLDEPTSGLDSHKAASVVKSLKRLADAGCTIIFTIHQPSYLLYSMLNKLILLDKGNTLYQGKAQEIDKYITSLGINLPKLSTISDFFIWEISDFKAQQQKYSTPLNSQNYTLRIEPEIRQEMQQSKGPDGYPIIRPATTFFFMLATLLRREWLLFIRNPMKFMGGIINAIVGIVIIGVFFINQIPSAQELKRQGSISLVNPISYRFLGIQGVSFMNVTSMVMNSLFTVQLAFTVDREIYYKESSSKKYYPITYFLSKIAVQLLNIAISAIFFGLATYWINGYQPTFLQFVKFILALLIMCLSGNSLGFLIGSLFKDQNNAAAIGPMITLPLMAFAGLYNKIRDIPSWISWMSYITPFRYGLHMILQNQYGDLVIDLADGSTYDYQADLQINLGFFQNALVSAGVAFSFYFIAFMALKRLSGQISS